MHYPHFEELNTTPAFLTLGVSAMRALRTYGWLQEQKAPPNVPSACLEKRKHVKTRTDAPVYLSTYIGVTKGRERWYGFWQVEGKPKNGPVHPLTDQGERWAAKDRARALGRDYLEKRDGTREYFKVWEPEEV